LRLEPASRSGLSLPWYDCLFPDRHPRIEVSGLLLRCLAELSTRPFGSRLLRSPRLAPVWARSAPHARFLFYAQHSPPLLGSPLPLGVFWTPPDQSVRSDSRPGSPSSENAPDGPSLPAAASIGIVAASDQRFRLASLSKGSFPLLEVLRCFSSLRLPRTPMDSVDADSGIPGSMLV